MTHEPQATTFLVAANGQPLASTPSPPPVLLEFFVYETVGVVDPYLFHRETHEKIPVPVVAVVAVVSP